MNNRNTPKKAAYLKKRQETAQHMNSFTDINGNVFTYCEECVKKDCPSREIKSTQGCMVGELKKELKEFL